MKTVGKLINKRSLLRFLKRNIVYILLSIFICSYMFIYFDNAYAIFGVVVSILLINLNESKFLNGELLKALTESNKACSSTLNPNEDLLMLISDVNAALERGDLVSAKIAMNLHLDHIKQRSNVVKSIK